jgi:hypothetical protein
MEFRSGSSVLCFGSIVILAVVQIETVRFTLGFNIVIGRLIGVYERLLF